jgi:hypothetical protein
LWAERGSLPSIGLRLTGAALVLLFSSQAGGEPVAPSRPAVAIQIELPPLVELDSIGGRDLLAAGNVATSGPGSGLSFDLGGYTSAGGNRPPAFRARVVRRVEKLWRVAVEGSTTAPESYEVRVDVIAPDGTAGVLGIPGDPASRLAARIVPLHPVRIEEGGATFLQGGVELELDLAAADRAGRYEGSLSVTLLPR